MNPKKTIKRGDIYFADLNPAIGSEQGGIRPCVIIQNDVGNRFSPTVIIAPLTAKTDKPNLPTHVQLTDTCCLEKVSNVLLEQIRVLDQSRVLDFIGRLDNRHMAQINKALAISIGL